MTAFADLTINDSVPAAHTFKARRIVDAIAKYQDISGGIAVGFPTITIGNREPIKNGEYYKISAKVILPVLETISGTSYAGVVAQPQLAFNLGFNGEFIIHQRSVLLARQTILAYAKNLLGNALMTALVQYLDFVA